MENQYQSAMLILLGIMQHLRLLQNCPALILHGPITVLRINVPTGDASQTNSNDEAKQRQPILNETPPIFGEESSSSETTSPRIELNEPTFYHISPCISRPLSEMTEEEQLEICQRLAIIGQMSSTIVREEDKRKEEKEIKSDTGTMIDQNIVTNKYCDYK